MERNKYRTSKQLIFKMVLLQTAPIGILIVLVLMALGTMTFIMAWFYLRFGDDEEEEEEEEVNFEWNVD